MIHHDQQVMLRIEKRVAFMMPMKLAMMPHLLEKYDYTFIIEEATLTFAMAKPKLKPQWQSFYHPITDEVWASILALLFLVPATLLMVGPDAVYRHENRTVMYSDRISI